MKHLAKFTLAFAILAIICALPLLAQREDPTDPKEPIYKSQNVFTADWTVAGGATTTCTNLFIDVRGMQNVTVWTLFCFSDATTSNAVFTVKRSVDKSNWETTGTTMTVAGNGTNYIVGTQEIDVGSAGWLKLDSIQNTHASLVLTNMQFGYGIKRNSP